MQDTKEGISNVDVCIAEALVLETTAFENIHVRPTASSSSRTCLESSKTEKEVEDNKEDIDEGVKLYAERSSSPQDATQSI